MVMKKKEKLTTVLSVFTMVLLCLPTLQQVWHPFTFSTLNGAVVDTEKPTLSLASYRDLSFQSQTERYTSENFGFREPLIRGYNQFLWMFRVTNNADVVVGKGQWLYGNHAVEDHYRQLPYNYADDNQALRKKFEKNTDRLKKVQTLLDEHGTKLFVMICPSKDMIYPEHLPDGHEYVMGDGLRAIEYIPAAFERKGINYVDMNAWFLQMKDSVSYPLYPLTGTHWSNVASMHVSDSLIRYLEKLTGKNMPNISVGPAYPSVTEKPDDDLEKIMNLAWRIRPNQNYSAKVELLPDPTAERLNLITIGDSYFWNIAYNTPLDELFESHPYWYYFSTVYYDANHDHVKQLNLKNELEQADAVMIMLTTYHLYDIFGGFLDKVIACYPAPDETYDSAVDAIMRKMELDSVWYQRLKDKAERKGKTLAEVMREDALYLIKLHPEKYLEEE